jgi:hypothetical protein
VANKKKGDVMNGGKRRRTNTGRGFGRRKVAEEEFIM